MISVYNSFDELPREIKEKARYPNQSNFFLSLDWFSLLYRTVFAEEYELRIYLAHDKTETPIGMLYCITKNKKTLISLTNYYSMEYSPVLLTSNIKANEVVHAIISYIANERPRWRSIKFRLLLNDSLGYESLTKNLRLSGFYVHTYFQYENMYYAPATKSFEEYYQERPSKLKNTIKRKEKILYKSYKVNIIHYTKPDEDLPKAISDYTHIYNNSWKKPEPYLNFIPSLVNKTAELGILRMGILYIDDKPIAAQLWITTSSKALIYKLSYTEEFKKLSAGSILSSNLFKLCMNKDNVDEIDYGVGSENYKKDWMNNVRELWGIEAYNKQTLRGLSNIFFMSLRKLQKKYLKSN